MRKEYLARKWKTPEITNDKQELMAYANNTVFEILDNIFGYCDESTEKKIENVIKSLKSGKDVESETYYGLKNKLNDKGLKQYLKYVYMYLDDFISSTKK